MMILIIEFQKNLKIKKHLDFHQVLLKNIVLK